MLSREGGEVLLPNGMPPNQVNTSDGGTYQNFGQVVGLDDGGYVIAWNDFSHTFSMGEAHEKRYYMEARRIAR